MTTAMPVTNLSSLAKTLWLSALVMIPLLRLMRLTSEPFRKRETLESIINVRFSQSLPTRSAR